MPSLQRPFRLIPGLEKTGEWERLWDASICVPAIVDIAGKG
jgi:hypothetical protein